VTNTLPSEQKINKNGKKWLTLVNHFRIIAAYSNKAGRQIMFHIPSFYVDPMPFGMAMETMKRRGNGDALEGMKSMDRLWEEYCTSSYTDEPMFEDDSAFFDTWSFECNAYNEVFESMSKLLAPKEVA
jgi:hypothetical protein